MALPQVIMGLGGLYANWRGAHEATKNLDKNLDTVAGYLSDYKQGIGDYQRMSKEYMDPSSSYNRSLLGQYQQTGADFAAQQNRMNQRNMYGGGLGGFSGLQQAMGQTAIQQAQSQAQDAWTQALQANRATGVSLLDKYVAGSKDYGETMAQGFLQNDQIRRMMKQAQWGGLGDALTRGTGDFGGNLLSLIGGKKS